MSKAPSRNVKFDRHVFLHKVTKYINYYTRVLLQDLRKCLKLILYSISAKIHVLFPITFHHYDVTRGFNELLLMQVYVSIRSMNAVFNLD